MTAHNVVCLHTMAGYFKYTSEMFHENGFGGTESHFGIRADGYAAQWQDLDHQADANSEGNGYCISIETEDHGDVFSDMEGSYWSNGSDVPAWTDEQIDKIVEIVTWLCNKYNIPKQLVPDSKPGRRGIGYHRQGIDPWRVSGGDVWSGTVGKVCPGDRRIEQLKTIVIPRVQGSHTAVAPIPTLEDDEEMTLVRNKVTNHVFAVCGGKLINITGESNVQSARNAGIPVWEVEDDEYNRIAKHCGPVLT